ncbi:MAG: DUF2156 domain-containing protein [Fusobacteriaceae bacterium]|nr:DUF2156 domain-containing protein [Fusobacteriaceae bacterium]
MWKQIDISSKEIIDSYTKGIFSICDYNFINLLIWSKGDNLQYKIENNVIYIKGEYLREITYFLPVSLDSDINEVKTAIDEILKKGYSINLIPENWKIKLEEIYFFEEQHDSFDYCYLLEELAFLKGRKYTKKRNKINQFMKKYDFKYEKIELSNIELVKEFQSNWISDEKVKNNKEIIKENLGIKEVLNNYFNLNLCGGVLFVDNCVVAYTIGEKIGNQMCVYIEKADEKYIGSYQMINTMFLRENADGIKIVNREDDAGVEGLREAKESYFPLELLKKYKIVSKKNI